MTRTQFARPSRSDPLSPGPSLTRPRRVNALPLLSGVLPTVYLPGNLPFAYQEIGPRDIVRLKVLSPGYQPPKPRWSTVGLGESLLATPSLYLFNPRVSKLRCHVSTPPGLHYALGPTLPRRPRDLADREFATPNLLPWKPRMLGFRYSGFVPPIHPQINDPDQIGRSHFAISTCMQSLHHRPRFTDTHGK
jgi:hypothetical protein